MYLSLFQCNATIYLCVLYKLLFKSVKHALIVAALATTVEQKLLVVIIKGVL